MNPVAVDPVASRRSVPVDAGEPGRWPAQPVDPVDPGKLLLPVLAPPVNRLPDAAAVAFSAAAGALMTQLAQAPGAGTTWTAADLAGATTAITTTLHPVATIEKPLAARLDRRRRRPAAHRPASSR